MLTKITKKRVIGRVNKRVNGKLNLGRLVVLVGLFWVGCFIWFRWFVLARLSAGQRVEMFDIVEYQDTD